MSELSQNVARHQPMRGDDIETWLKRERDCFPRREDGAVNPQWWTLNWMLDRYRECADYGLSLRAEDDERGDP